MPEGEVGLAHWVAVGGRGGCVAADLGVPWCLDVEEGDVGREEEVEVEEVVGGLAALLRRQRGGRGRCGRHLVIFRRQRERVQNALCVIRQVLPCQNCGPGAVELGGQLLELPAVAMLKGSRGLSTQSAVTVSSTAVAGGKRKVSSVLEFS